MLFLRLVIENKPVSKKRTLQTFKQLHEVDRYSKLNFVFEFRLDVMRLYESIMSLIG